MTALSYTITSCGPSFFREDCFITGWHETTTISPHNFCGTLSISGRPTQSDFYWDTFKTGNAHSERV